MNGKAFLNAVANGEVDLIQIFLDEVAKLGAEYCVIGGLAVNAYAEPVVSLDLDVVVAAEDVEKICSALQRTFEIERFAHSVNLTGPKSDIRIQLQTDPRYQAFLSSATVRAVLGYEMRVASLEDVLQGKTWAYSDKDRRKSKRQKDLADIMRLVETHPQLAESLPESLQGLLD